MMDKPIPSSADHFQGFEYPDANFIYCPNQFFDVCLSLTSRPAIRTVSYVLRQTLGWLNSDGEPIQDHVEISYGQLIELAGVSRGSIPQAIKECTARNFIRCIDAGSKNTSGRAARHARYALVWDGDAEYTREPGEFAGFFSGEGHRTPIPNSFFDFIVPSETLAVIKVVGTVLRHTIGYQTQCGGRRSSAPLSYSMIQSYANISDRKTLSAALERALLKGYIERIEEGQFHSDAVKRRPAVYRASWLDKEQKQANGSKTKPAYPKQFKKPTSNGSKTKPAERFKNPTSRKDKNKHKEKQQHVAADSNAFISLIQIGFDETTARDLSDHYPEDAITNQIRWLKLRRSDRNALGLLRKAIEEGWDRPKAGSARLLERCDKTKRPVGAGDPRSSTDDARRKRLRARQALLKEWGNLSNEQRETYHRAAIDTSTSNAARRALLHCRDLSNPPQATLMMMAQSLALQRGE